MIQSDAFKGDPDGYGRNQLWHTFIGGVVFMVVASIARNWLADSAAMWAGGVVIALGLLYLLIVEIVLQGWVLPWDSIEDTCHFALGATYMALAISDFWLAAAGVMLCQGGIILFGEWGRS